MTNADNKATTAPTDDPKEKTYKPKDEVIVKQADGTLVSCTHAYYKKHYSSDEIVGDYVPPTDPRTLELEKKLEEYADSLTD